jgi:transcription elongation factor GreA
VNGKPLQLTPAGKQALEAELAQLRQRRDVVLRRIQDEREYGVIGEVGESYTDREELALLEGRIQQLDDELRRAVLVTTHDATKVSLGATVRVVDQDGGDETFTIVSAAEAQAATRHISDVSPVGRALLGKRVGETVSVRVPAGTVTYTVQEIT